MEAIAADLVCKSPRSSTHALVVFLVSGSSPNPPITQPFRIVLLRPRPSRPRKPRRPQGGLVFSEDSASFEPGNPSGPRATCGDLAGGQAGGSIWIDISIYPSICR